MDREKVIKALEYCKDNQHVNDCDKCDYGGKTGMFCIRMIDDVIAILKEQEAKPIAYTDNPYTGLPVARCPKCAKFARQFHSITTEETHYCPWCGQAVKWK